MCTMSIMVLLFGSSGRTRNAAAVLGKVLRAAPTLAGPGAGPWYAPHSLQRPVLPAAWGRSLAASLSRRAALYGLRPTQKAGGSGQHAFFFPLASRPPLSLSLAAPSRPCPPGRQADGRPTAGGRAGGARGGGSSGSGSLCGCRGGSGEDGGPGGFPVCGSERRRRSLGRGRRGGCPGPGWDAGTSRANGPGAGPGAVPLPDAGSGLSGERGRRRGARAGGGAERGPGRAGAGGGEEERSRREGEEQEVSPPAPGKVG